ncbi:HTH domain-containing protein [Lysinibacillus pakistanensis]|uniref:XRE family transcriptional regulator n=1 Tax=Lysinibacillus pakistanensis TaxID=759811 RepID=A0ABX6DAM6_9BACI|nr:hypothetical protein GDS87_13350 [Lysinibacillus pakistanensis]
MGEFRDSIEVSFVSNSSPFDYLIEDIQKLAEKFNFNHQQLSKILDLSINELGNLLNRKGNITKKQQENIENKLAMLNFGFEGFDAKERVTLILNDLLSNYRLTTETLSKIINVKEKELIDFNEKQIIDTNVEMKICVNVIMLHFVLHPSK